MSNLENKYRISLIRSCGYYNFQHAGPRGDCPSVAFTRGYSNKLQVPVDLS